MWYNSNFEVKFGEIFCPNGKISNHSLWEVSKKKNYQCVFPG